jgi:hypothetical protein
MAWDDGEWRKASEKFEDRMTKHSSPEDVLDGRVPIKRGDISKGNTHPMLAGGNVGKSVLITLAAAPVVVGAPVAQQVASGAVPAEGLTILDVSGDERHSQILSVVLYVNDIPVPTAGAPHAARAAVRLGAGGSRTEFLMDFMRGVAFSLPASSVRINVVTDPFGAPPAVFEGIFGAMAAYGYLGRTRQPQLTLSQLEIVAGAYPLLPGAAADWTIPAFAESVTLWNMPDNAYLVRILNPVGGIEYEQDFGILGNEPNNEIKISNTATTIRLINQDGVVDIDSTRLIFQLAI